LKEVFDEIESIDYDVAKHYDHLVHETNLYLKIQAFKDAMLKGVDLIEAEKNPLEYKDIIESALKRDLLTNDDDNFSFSMPDLLKLNLPERQTFIGS